MTNLEKEVLNAIEDLLEMFEGASTIESATLIDNAKEYGLNTKQVRAVLVSSQEKGIIKLFKYCGEQLIELQKVNA